MTPAINLLRQRKIQFKLHPYTVDPSSESYGEEAAKALGVDKRRVFKTLVVETDNQSGILEVALVPVSSRLDLKRFAKEVQAKKAKMAQPAEVERKTGYILGGVSPLAQKQAHRTIIHRSVNDFATVFVSAGKRGIQIEISPDSLINLTDSQLADIAI